MEEEGDREGMEERWVKGVKGVARSRREWNVKGTG